MSHPPARGIWFYHGCVPPTISLWLLLCLWTLCIFFFCLLFFGRFKHLPVDCYSTASCDFDSHAAEDECMSYSTFLNQKLSPFFKLKIITVKLICLHLIWSYCLHQWCIKSIDCPYNFFLKLLCYNPVIIVLVWLFQRPLSTTKSQS